MAFPEREYYRLEALAERWDISQDDVFYAIENGLLRACVWLPLRYVERVVMIDRKFVCESCEHQVGFVGVRPEDCRRICSTGRAKLRIFTSICEDEHVLRLAYEPPQPAVCVRLNDLIVLKEDSEKFERQHDVAHGNIYAMHPEKAVPLFSASNDYRFVCLDNEEYHLGDVQARVIEQLHDASQSHQPWVHGKTLIYESGSEAARLRDLFKNKRTWNGLIISNERDCYRLNVPLEEFQKHPTHRAVERQQASC